MHDTCNDGTDFVLRHLLVLTYRHPSEAVGHRELLQAGQPVNYLPKVVEQPILDRNVGDIKDPQMSSLCRVIDEQLKNRLYRCEFVL